MSRKLGVLAWLAAVSLLTGPLYAQSQATTGQISGRLVDATGAALPGVTVTITNPATGVKRSVTSGGEGLYTVPLLPPGAYEVTAELSNFQTAKYSDVKVTVGSNVTLNVTLGVSGVAEVVTVVSQASLVETNSSTRSSTLSLAAIDNLPINGRRFQDFITLTPTVQVDTSRGQLSIAGQRGINSNVSIDGGDWNQPFFGGIRGGERSNSAFTIPQEAIQEFQVVAAGYTAEFGRSTGGIVNAVTKTGTNELKGSAFYLNRGKGLAEKNAFGQNAAPTQQLFGGSLGGPLQKDKLFFFAAFEAQRIKNDRAVLFDRLAGLAPTAATQEAFDYYKSLEEPFQATNDATTFLGRIDYQIDSSNRVSVRYSHSSNNALNSNSTGNALDATTISALSNNGTEKDSTNVVVGQLTSVLQPGLLLEVRGQWSREERPRPANFQGPNITNVIGRTGTVNFLGQNVQFDWRGQGAANLSWIKDKHTAKFGAEFNHVYVNQTFGFNQYGFYNISGTNTTTILDLLSVGGSVANRFDSSDATYLRQIGNLALDFSTDEMAVYAQDTWRIRPNFTVNFGVRWEGMWNPTPDTNNDTLLNRVKGVTFPNGRTVDPTQIPDETGQFGPRVGFAWDPKSDAKTVVRGYGGIYYARTPALLYAGPMNNFRVPPGDLSIQLPFTVPASNPNKTIYKQFLLIGIDLNKIPLDQLPNVTPEQLTQIAQALGLSVDPFFWAGPIAVDQNYQNPKAYHVGLGVERQIADGLSVGIEGTLVKTTHLQRNLDMNLPVPVIRASDPAQRPFFGVLTGTPRPVTTVGSMQVREATARSLFRGITVSSRLQRKWGQVNVFYVLSKSESDDDNERDSGGQSAENAFNLAPEYGPAKLDRRHQFNGGMVFFLPLGFDIATGFRFLSGLPIDATFGSDANGDRFSIDRPYSAPGVPFTRNAFRNKPIKDVNIRIQKGFKFAERHRVVFSFEAFNVFNWDNIQLLGTTVTNYCSSPTPLDCGFGAPTNVNFLQILDQNPTSSRFGQYLLNNSPGSPRQIQFGIRYQF